jgi:hypothetical protein
MRTLDGDIPVANVKRNRAERLGQQDDTTTVQHPSNFSTINREDAKTKEKRWLHGVRTELSPCRRG